MADFEDDHTSQHHHNHHKSWWWGGDSFINRRSLLSLFCLLFLLFLLGILIWEIVLTSNSHHHHTDFIKSKEQEKIILNKLKDDFSYYIVGADGGSTTALCFSRKYIYIDPSNSSSSSSTSTFLDNLKEINDPTDYLYSKNDDTKFYLLQGTIHIQKRIFNVNEEGEESDDEEEAAAAEGGSKNITVFVSYNFVSNLPLFSAIKLAEIGLDTSNYRYKIKKTHSLCTSEYQSNRRCDTKVGTFYRDYYSNFQTTYSTSSSSPSNIAGVGTSKNTTTDTKKYLEEQLRGHYEKIPSIKHNDSNHNNNNRNNIDEKENLTQEVILLNEIEHSTVYNILFFINENIKEHPNNLGKIAFIIEPSKCR